MVARISIIISTYNRYDDLKKTLNCIYSQSLLPYELIIVDDSTDDKIKELMSSKKLLFKTKYIKPNTKLKSLTISRNLGIKKATGDILLFLDDDVTLNKTYLEELLNTYQDEKVVAVQGYIKNISINPYFLYFDRFIQTLFFNSDLKFKDCKVKKGVFGNTYPIKKPKQQIESQWLSGCNMSYRTEFLKKNNLEFDENLLRYAFKEDVDLSYRVYKICKNKKQKMVLNPKMLLDHRISKISRIPNSTYTKIKYAYTEYFFFKNTNTNLIIFYWSLLGHIIQRTILSIIRRDRSIIGNISGVLYSFKHLSELKACNLDNINKELFN